MRVRLILVGGLLIVLAVVALGFAVLPGRQFWPAPESLSYRGRDYIEPRTITAAEMKKNFGPLRDMHTRRRGLALFVLKGVSPRGEVPTIVLLRRWDGRYEVYGLSGGP